MLLLILLLLMLLLLHHLQQLLLLFLLLLHLYLLLLLLLLLPPPLIEHANLGRAAALGRFGSAVCEASVLLRSSRVTLSQAEAILGCPQRGALRVGGHVIGERKGWAFTWAQPSPTSPGLLVPLF